MTRKFSRSLGSCSQVPLFSKNRFLLDFANRAEPERVSKLLWTNFRLVFVHDDFGPESKRLKNLSNLSVCLVIRGSEKKKNNLSPKF